MYDYPAFFAFLCGIIFPIAPRDLLNVSWEKTEVLKKNLRKLMIGSVMGFILTILLHGCGSGKASDKGENINIVPSVPVLP